MSFAVHSNSVVALTVVIKNQCFVDICEYSYIGEEFLVS